MTDPSEESRDPAYRRRVLIVGLILTAAAAAAVVVAISAGPRNTGNRSSVNAEMPVGEKASDPTPATAEQTAAEPTETTPDEPPEQTTAPSTSPDADASGDGAAPSPQESPAAGVEADLEAVLESLTTGLDTEAITRLSRSGDLRVAWVIADLMRFFHPEESGLRFAFIDLTGVEIAPGFEAWRDASNKVMEWDTPAPPGFAKWKGAMYTLVEPGWLPFFADEDSLIDWRHVTWGGVRIDDRPLDAVHLPCPRGCIPALNDPRLVPASEGDYYPDDSFVFAVSVNGEAVAFPKNMMEIHEMVNITIGGRRLGIPYCTLCGSAQAYFTDDVPDSVRGLLGGADTFELRTSGLLSRSNKMMYEFHTRSMFDTFTGDAVSGPLREAGVRLPQTTMVTSRWGEWKEANPHTLIVAEDGGIGRSYPADPLGTGTTTGLSSRLGVWTNASPSKRRCWGCCSTGERSRSWWLSRSPKPTPP